MENRWNDADAQAAVERYGRRGVPEELALRVYTSRLIGGDPALVLHGGGNTSVKGHAPDALGEEVPVLYVKGSGWDLASIEPEGFPAVRLEPIRALRHVRGMSDAGMVNALRTHLLDAAAPNPSVEALLHAFLPHRFVDHTHADAILALVDQPEPEARCREVFGERLAVLPFVFPGFPLAGIAMEAYERDPAVEGIVLVNHGLFTFGETARESYERMIRYVGLAEEALAEARRGDGRRLFHPRGGLPEPDEAELAQVAATLRGALATADEAAPGGWRRMLLHFRTAPAIRAFVDGEGLDDYARRGVATPDHIIRTKNLPLVLPPLSPGDTQGEGPARLGARVREAVGRYGQRYRDYFEAGCRHSGEDKVMLDPLPRIVLLPGAGFFAAGRTEKEARIAADIYEHTIGIITAAERYGRYTPLEPLELFGMEYWSLEQAKLGSSAEPPLARQVALVTGAASGIGAAIAQQLAQSGARVILADLELSAAQAQADKIGHDALATAADVSKPEEVEALVGFAVQETGALHMMVNNAGIGGAQAPTGDYPLDSWHQVIGVNLNGVFYGMRYAIPAIRDAGGGAVVNIASILGSVGFENACAYVSAKHAVVGLTKTAALEHAADKVRINSIGPGFIHTPLIDKHLDAATQEALAQMHALGRLGKPEEVADLTCYLLSDRASFVTGSYHLIDGGYTAR